MLVDVGTLVDVGEGGGVGVFVGVLAGVSVGVAVGATVGVLVAVGAGVGSGMRMVMGSGVGVSAIEGVGVVARCDVGEVSGSSEHADKVAKTAVHTTAIRAIRSRLFRVRGDATKLDFIWVVCSKSRVTCGAD